MSTSFLLILIVVLWLFVLAPLVVNTRKPIRRTSDALGKTRVLHRGGDELATTRRRPSFTEADVRVTEDVDESLETVNASVDDDFDVSDVLIDDTEDKVTDPAVVDGDIVYELEPAESAAPEAAEGALDSDAEQVASADAESSEAEPADASAADDDDELIGVADDSEELSEGAAEISEVEAHDKTSSDSVRADATSADVRVDARREFVDADDLMFDDSPEPEAGNEDEAVSESDAAKSDTAESDAEVAAEAYSEEADSISASSLEPTSDSIAVDDSLTEDDYAFAEKRRGRGGFDPVSDARYAETRFARRRRSVAGLAAFIVVTILIAVFVGGWTWWIPLVGTGLMAVYLVSLRRTVRAEQELRARRIRRMKMARLGVRHREDEELGIPQRLLRPGAVVVELDDEDPDFADLAYSDYRFDDDDYDEIPQERVS